MRVEIHTNLRLRSISILTVAFFHTSNMAAWFRGANTPIKYVTSPTLRAKFDNHSM